jgi:hypothetical protein
MKAVAGHPNRYIREAIALVLNNGWTLRKSGPRAHIWGLLYCPQDDGTPGTCNGVFSIDFHREAASLEAAIRSAIEDVRTAGYAVARVEIAAEAVVQTD